MRTPQDLASNFLVSDGEHGRRATTLRRLAGGVRAQSVGELGLNNRERKVLGDATALLERMADASKQAAGLAKKRAVDLATREKSVRAAMSSNFGALASVADQVALIGAVQNHVLKDGMGRFDDPRRLREAFADAIASLAYTIARFDDKETAEVVVAEAWAKFEEAKSSIQTRHQPLIDALTVRGSDYLAALTPITRLTESD